MHCLGDTFRVVKVHGEDPERACAHDVTIIADDERVAHGITDDATAILERLGVAKCDDGRDTVLNGLIEILNGAVGDRGSLAVLRQEGVSPYGKLCSITLENSPVACCNDLRAWTLGYGLGE